MPRRAWILARATPLCRALPRAQFAEYHFAVVERSPSEVFDAYHRMTWSDLRLGRLLLSLRGFGLVGSALRRPIVTPPSPAAPIHEEPPTYSTSGMIGKPWLPVPASRPVASLDDLAAFTEPGWLKYGMEWRFTGTEDGRTLVETATLCQATSRSSQAFFSAYWTLIRAGSGLIRREMLQTLGRSRPVE